MPNICTTHALLIGSVAVLLCILCSHICNPLFDQSCGWPFDMKEIKGLRTFMLKFMSRTSSTITASPDLHRNLSYFLNLENRFFVTKE